MRGLCGLAECLIRGGQGSGLFRSMGRDAGLSSDLLLEVIANSTAACWSAEDWHQMRRMSERHPGEERRQRSWDIRISATCVLAWKIGRPVPLAALASRLLERPFGSQEY